MGIVEPRSEMSKSLATVVTLTAALLAIAIPVLLAIYLSDQQAREAEMNLVSAYARDVLHRSETTSDQALRATDALSATHSPDPCADANLAIMRRFDLGSSYLQAIGHVVNSALECSSLGRDAGALPLGPVDWITPMGIKIRSSVKFPFDPLTAYLVMENAGGFTAIINKELPLDAATGERDVTLAAFATNNGRLYAAHGYFDPHWTGTGSSVLPRRRSRGQ